MLNTFCQPRLRYESCLMNLSKFLVLSFYETSYRIGRNVLHVVLFSKNGPSIGANLNHDKYACDTMASIMP